MFVNKYSNFVRAGFSEQGSQGVQAIQPTLTGEEARRLYLEEIKDAKPHSCSVGGKSIARPRIKKKINDEDLPFTDNDLFVCVQKNNVHQLKNILDKHPEKINIVDNYGWNLLMIACQANSVETAIELLKRRINTSIRDKAGNTAHSLVIKSKNYALADALLKYRETNDQSSPNKVQSRLQTDNVEYMCDICNKKYPDRKEHLSSTIHNINASKNVKVPVNYVIPPSNRGFQLMMKGGWDSVSGLGRDGSGKKYPIKTIQKKDRKGLGLAVLKKNNIVMVEDVIKHHSKKMYLDKIKKDRSIEIKFRREFY